MTDQLPHPGIPAARLPAGASRGRPRDSSRDDAIHEAALGLLLERGYDQLSVESVAARAGVSKATIYRRHPNKAALVAAAVEHRAAADPPDTAGLGLRDSLLVTLRWLARQVGAQDAGFLGAAFAGMRSDPALAAAMRQVLDRDRAAMTQRVLAPAAEHGEPLARGAAELFAEVGPAVVVHRVLFAHEPCDEHFLQHLADDVLLPLLRGSPAGPRPAGGPPRHPERT